MVVKWILALILCFALTTVSEASFRRIKIIPENAKKQLSISDEDYARIADNLHRKRAKANRPVTPVNFTGPTFLEPLRRQCFVFESDRYLYRICPFSNVTQHEKTKYAFNFVGGFHAILGLWNGWYVHENQFHSLIYLHGDECEPNLNRRVQIELKCKNLPSDLAIVSNVTEVKRCFYRAQLSSKLFCEMANVYSRLDSAGRMEWNVIETLYRKQKLTTQGYEHYLQSLLGKYDLVRSIPKHILPESTPNDSDNIDQCRERLAELERENSQLKIQIGK